MIIEPDIDHAALIEQVRAHYRLPVQSLAFLPHGEVGLAYRLECAPSAVGGERFFLKLWPDDRVGRSIRARLGTVLPVLYELHQRRLVENVVAPIPTTQGALQADFGAYALALFPYIDGRPVEECADGSSQFAHTLASLHRATPQLKTRLPSWSPFAVGFGPDLRRGLGALERITSEARSGRRQLRAMLFPRRAALVETLRTVEALGRQAERRAGQLVLCHTDIAGNALLNADGRLMIIDWDELLLAPPEHDLQQCRDGDFAAFLAEYRSAGGTAELDPLQFRFYLLRRYLADLVDWLIRILEENETPEQDISDLNGIQNYCLYRLYYFEQEMERITQAIEATR